MEPYSTRISTLRSCTHGYSLALDSGPQRRACPFPSGVSALHTLARFGTSQHRDTCASAPHHFPVREPHLSACLSSRPAAASCYKSASLPRSFPDRHLVLQPYSSASPKCTQPSLLRIQLHPQQHVWPIHPRLRLRYGEGRAHPAGRDTQRPPLCPRRRTRRRAQPRCPLERG